MLLLQLFIVAEHPNTLFIEIKNNNNNDNRNIVMYD